MKTIIGLLLAAGVSAQEGLPFSKSFPEKPALQKDAFGNIIPLAPVPYPDRHPICATEDSFFKKELAFKPNLANNIAFTFKGKNSHFVGVDTPFSSEANAQSMLMLEEEETRESQEIHVEREKKITLQDSPTAKLLEKAETELTRAEQQLQEMGSQSYENPNILLDPNWNELRKKMIKQQGYVQNRVMLLKDQLLAEQKRGEHDVTGENLENLKFDVWYVNMNQSTARKDCIERQLSEAGIENVNRYPAVQINGLTKEGRKLLFQASKAQNSKKAELEYVRQLKEIGYGDCVEGGLDYEGTMTHGSGNSKAGKDTNEWHQRNAIIANYCGHKRLLKQLENDPEAAEYIVVMEDDTIVDRTFFKHVIQDFIANFDKTQKWSMVQLDPFGYKSSEDFLGHFRGKPVWKPQFKAPCSQYWGFQAVIFKKSALPKVNKWLAENPAMPIDWLQYKIDNTLAFSSLIARNPESLTNENWVIAEDRKKVVLPNFCAKNVMKSTIARQKITEGMFSK